MKRNVEDETSAIMAWWQRNCKPFSEWFLKLSDDERLELLHRGCPDLPKLNARARQAAGETLKATDMLLPELTEDALTASGGKICILFMTRRCTSVCIDADLKLLYDLEYRKQLPVFDVGQKKQLENIDTPFIDPSDPEENIRSLSAETSKETRQEVLDGFKTGRFVTFDCWVASKIRRTAIAAFLKALIEGFEKGCDSLWTPKPLLEELIQAELKMQALDAEMTEKANASSIESLS